MRNVALVCEKTGIHKVSFKQLQEVFLLFTAYVYLVSCHLPAMKYGNISITLMS